MSYNIRYLQANAYNWCSDTGQVAEGGLSSNLLGSYTETNCVVPTDKDSDIGNGLSHHANEQQSWHDTVTETMQVPKVAARELTSQERDTAISRYKEKKKSRRYLYSIHISFPVIMSQIYCG